MTDATGVRRPDSHTNDASQFGEMIREEAVAILGWCYDSQHAFYDTQAGPEFAGFNRRAITVYDRLGFVETGRVSRAAPELAGETVEFIEMALG